MNLSREQRRAVECRERFVCLAAGAGSGKTLALVARYIWHLKQGLAPSQIAAITFTEKAGEEMRMRIRREVRKIPSLASVLPELDDAPITTIHGLCARLLRAHAFDADLDPGFSVEDEIVSDARYTRTAAAGLAAALEKNFPPACRLVEGLGFAAAAGAVARALAEPIASSRILSSLDEVQAMLKELQVREISRLARTGETRALLDADADVLPRGYAEALPLACQLCRTVGDGDPPETVLAAAQALASAKFSSGGQRDEAKPICKAIKELRDGVQAILDARAASPEADERQEALTNAFHDTVEFVRRWERERSGPARVVSYDELLLRVRDLLRAGVPVGRRFRAVLVDEFQDTDPVQDEIVQALAAGTGRSLFIVGDAMQSIYGFRGAQVEVFLERAAMAKAGQESALIKLPDNYRSAPAIIDFVNATFSPLPYFIPLRGRRTSPQGLVRFLECGLPGGCDAEERGRREAAAVAAKVEEILGDLPVVDPQTGQSRAARPGDVAVILRAMTRGYLFRRALAERGIPAVVIAGKGFFSQQEVDDIVHLLRALEDPLDDAALVGLLRSPAFAASDEALLVLREHAGRSGPLWQALPAASADARLEPFDRQALADCADILAQARLLLRTRGVARALDLVLRETGLQAALSACWLGEQRSANLSKALSRVAQMEAAGMSALEIAAALRRAGRSRLEEGEAPLVSETGDAVRIITAHKAKGLEFPVVFLPQLAEGARGRGSRGLLLDTRLGPAVEPPGGGPGSRSALLRARKQEQEREELVRLLYVACTRARDALFLSYALEEGKEPKGGSWLACLREAKSWPNEALTEKVPEPARPPGYSPRGQGRPTLPSELAALARAPSPAGEAVAATTLGGPARGSPGGARPREGAAAFGEAVHAAVERLLAGGIPEGSDEVLRAAESFLATEVGGALAAAEEMACEEPLAIVHQGLLIEGRADILASVGGERWVVDLKTGEPEPEAERVQLAIYAEAVRRAVGVVPRCAIARLEGDGWRFEEMRFTEKELSEILQAAVGTLVAEVFGGEAALS